MARRLLRGELNAMTFARSDRSLDAAVLGYLEEHPHAMDTLEGIAEWWIERERIRFDVARVAGALARLVDRGVLERIGAGECALYRLSREPTTRSPDPDSG